eukprot:scaffold1129_cov376-Prasinococcus_capsulatus_cf.AAC.5
MDLAAPVEHARGQASVVSQLAHTSALPRTGRGQQAKALTLIACSMAHRPPGRKVMWSCSPNGTASTPPVVTSICSSSTSSSGSVGGGPSNADETSPESGCVPAAAM